jgi:uncharacterized membrane protein
MSEVDVEEDEDVAGQAGGRLERSIAALIALLALAGAGVAGYLTYVHWFDKSIACVGLHSCAEVAQSDYAWVWNVPVAFLGLLGYLAIFAASTFWLRVGNRFDVRPLLAIWGMSLAGFAYSVYLTYVELFVIDAVCIWCASSAIIMTVVFLVATAALLTLGRDSELFED